MIVGNGDIASVLKDRPDFCFFASGVSNSQEIDEKEYTREKSLLLKQNRKLHLVYFGSLAIFYGHNRYVQHKKEMEELVKQNFSNYTIIRLGNITWGKNPHTLINAMRLKFENGEKLEIKNDYRYLINRKEFLHWIGMIPEWNCEMNIPGRMMKVKEIVKEYVL